MIYLVVIFFVAIIILLARIFSIKKEIKNITKQISSYNSLKSSKKIDIKLFDRDIENLAENINKYISISNELQINNMKSQDELKRTIANISHDLRTPLTSILGYIQMIKNNTVDENKKREYIEITEKRAKYLQNLLNDFFDLSLLESSDYELNLEYINLNNILCDELAGFYEYFVSRDINPKIDIPNKDVMVIGDISATKRVLENLMINIAKHSNGYVYIGLSEEGLNAVVTIINESENLTSKDVELMFDRFYTNDKSRNSKDRNTGLGLFIVRELMDKMNGDIKCEIKNDLLHIQCIWSNKTL